jgi:hypothetical protein
MPGIAEAASKQIRQYVGGLIIGIQDYKRLQFQSLHEFRARLNAPRWPVMARGRSGDRLGTSAVDVTFGHASHRV